ncbi:MAG TPA: bifunctional DNA primase/polymerase [Gemmataceae bacterium]|nr:bifunctional DNA primase/polymerase [Gemmataceae bacterium]
MLSHALAYASAGWLVFPLHTPEPDGCSCRKPTCSQHGKHPRWLSGSLEHGSLSATAGAEQLRLWWRCWPDANIGVRTGEGSGFVMIGPDGEQGIADLAALVDQHGPLPDTPVAVSGGGGRHYLFRHPGDRIPNKANHRGTKIDVRGEGGLFVAAPSLHRSGNRYAWHKHPSDVPIAEAPTWLVEWMRERQRPLVPNRRTFPRDPSGAIEERAARYIAEIPTPVCGNGACSRILFRAACVLVEGFDIEPDTAFPLLDAWARRGSHPWAEADIRRACTNATKRKTDAGYLLVDRFTNAVDLGPAEHLSAAMSSRAAERGTR